MRVVVMESAPERLRDVAQSWGVPVVAGQDAAVTHAAIEAAYVREVEAEARRAMRRVREVRR